MFKVYFNLAWSAFYLGFTGETVLLVKQIRDSRGFGGGGCEKRNHFLAFGAVAASFWWFCSFRQFCFGVFISVVSVVSLALVSFWSFLFVSVVSLRSFRSFHFAVSGFSTCLLFDSQTQLKVPNNTDLFGFPASRASIEHPTGSQSWCLFQDPIRKNRNLCFPNTLSG